MKNKILKAAKIISISIGVITVIAFWVMVASVYLEYDEACVGDDIAIIEMHGRLDLVSEDEAWTSSAERVVAAIEKANSIDSVEVIVLDIYSSGGVITAGEEVMNALKRSPKKTIALIREMGSSAAYLAASGADKIYATEFSEIGSIGITMSYLDYTKKDIKEGAEFIDLSSAEFKDMFSHGRSLTEEEQKKINEFIDELHKIMVQKIAENRSMKSEKMEELADGSIFTARKSKEVGMIDSIGGFYKIYDDFLEKGLDIEPCYITPLY